MATALEGFGIGFAAGVQLCELGFVMMQTRKLKRTWPLFFLFVNGAWNVLLCCVKLSALTGSHITSCETDERINVVLYVGSKTIQYTYYILMYQEIYPRSSIIGVITAWICNLGWTANIAVFEAFNTTSRDPETGSCVISYPISVIYGPPITCIAMDVVILTLLVIPLIGHGKRSASLNEWGKEKYNKILVIGKTMLVTTLVADVVTAVFNATLSTPAGAYTVVTAPLEAMINFTCVIIPYYVKSRYDEGGSKHEITEYSDDGKRVSQPHTVQ
ncbi:hypothetical protein HDU78_003776 [Chytriomyces hyalinus]|nr:hypothetical protein HDU78_003776 [Chytriomyces hyalinus]KAJ3263811.1 hypothetical protein HDU77_009966 [Chytriomyces hyalinus]KAJ3403648.1 hypothetical protein HDU80_003929 [Chytriomyces hyalinus]